MFITILVIIVIVLVSRALIVRLNPVPKSGEKAEIIDWTENQSSWSGIGNEFSWNRNKLYIKRSKKYIKNVYICFFMGFAVIAYGGYSASQLWNSTKGVNISIYCLTGLIILVILLLKFRDEPQVKYFDFEKLCFVFSGMLVYFNEITALQILEKQYIDSRNGRYRSLYELNLILKDNGRIDVIQMNKNEIMERYVSDISERLKINVVRNYEP